MKKMIHILEGFIILTIIFIGIMLFVKFIYKINHEKIDTSYLLNVKLDNLIIKEGSTSGNLSIEDNTIYLDVTLKKEQEFYEFTFAIENNGTLEIKLEDYNITIENPKNILTYKVTYLDLSEIKKEDIIKSQDKKTIKVRIDYPKQKDKVYEALNLNLSLTFKYSTIS